MPPLAMTCVRLFRSSNGPRMGPVLIALLGLVIAAPGQVQAQDEPMADRLRDLTGTEVFRVTALAVSAVHVSFQDDDFRGGRTFSVDYARLGLGGTVDGGFHYRFQVELTRASSLLDAYLGYRFSDGLNVRAGAQKPQISRDLLPSPVGVDFMDRARLVGAQLRSRELGVNLFGDLSGYRYDLGIWNGSGLTRNPDNRFLITGRLAREFPTDDGGTLGVGGNLAFGECFSAACGFAGLAGDGSRVTLGADVRYESDRWLWAGEILTTTLDVAHVILDEERIVGFHLTAGYRTGPDTRVLARLDRLEFQEQGPANTLLVLGVNHRMTRLMAFKVNLLALLDGDADDQVGLSAGWEFVF